MTLARTFGPPTAAHVESGAVASARTGVFSVPSPFHVFVLMYAAAFLLELVEHWRHPLATAFFVGLTTLLLLRINRLTFLLYLVASSTYLIAWRFPEVANHVNLIIFANAGLLLGVLWSFVPRARIADDDAFYEMIQPIMRLIIIGCFASAGFHKFNEDFVNPAVSCIGLFTGNLWETFRSDFLGIGIPTGVAIGAVAAGAGAVLWRQRRNDFALPGIDWAAVLAPAVAIAGIAALVLTLVGTDGITGPKAAAIFLVAVFVLCWQLVEGPLLLVARFQWVALALSLLVHAVLAMLKVVDFQAIALALLITFVPPNVWQSWRRQAMVSIASVKVNRAWLYVIITIFINGSLMLLHNHTGVDIAEPYIVTGLLFNTALIVLLWPIFADLFSRERSWSWRGVPVTHPSTPKLLYLVPVALVLFGLTSHLGLRSAGNFSMFSNLRTETEQSNHLIFANNPIKVFGYLDDRVTIAEINDDAAKIGHQYHPLRGQSLPVVEFRKLLYLWQQEGRVVPMTLEYGGATLRTDDINAEPQWQVDGRDWEMRLLDFRIVQAEGPNRCRW